MSVLNLNTVYFFRHGGSILQIKASEISVVAIGELLETGQELYEAGLSNCVVYVGDLGPSHEWIASNVRDEIKRNQEAKRLSWSETLAEVLTGKIQLRTYA